MTTPLQALEPFVRRRTVLLTTYRRDGTPVGTPVNIAVEGDRAFVRTFDRAWKAKRIRNNPLAEIAPSTMRGKPTAPAIRVRVRLLSGDEASQAARALDSKYRILQGVMVPLAHRLRGYKTLHYELVPIDE
jgi:PPOX class probable F420-dependent enzyme